MEITQEKLKELFNYDPETGIFTRKIKTSNRVKIGDIASWDNGNGYHRININGKQYYCHRLAWLYINGHIEKNIDHINGLRNDNRIKNLRQSESYQNNQNLKICHKDNSSGFLGVSFDKTCNKFVSKIQIKGKSKTIGYFNTALEAHEKYLEEKRAIHEFCTI